MRYFIDLYTRKGIYLLTRQNGRLRRGIGIRVEEKEGAEDDVVLFAAFLTCSLR